jgi:hypothetical protein
MCRIVRRAMLCCAVVPCGRRARRQYRAKGARHSFHGVPPRTTTTTTTTNNNNNNNNTLLCRRFVARAATRRRRRRRCCSCIAATTTTTLTNNSFSGNRHPTLRVLHQHDPAFVPQLSDAVESGETVLVESVGSRLLPAIMPLVQRAIKLKGKGGNRCVSFWRGARVHVIIILQTRAIIFSQS